MARTSKMRGRAGTARKSAPQLGTPASNTRNTRAQARKQASNPISKKAKAKKRKKKPGVVALREIEKWKTSTEWVIKETPFRRLVREISNEFLPDGKWQVTALVALQDVVEAFLVSKF